MVRIPFVEYLDLQNARRACVEEITQGQAHIKPLHRHFAMRLVIEGGFPPQEITPHPPFKMKQVGKRFILELDENLGSTSEQTVIGGVKTKQVDVTVSKHNIGPVVAISFKATQNSFRNLTNRMEEAVGDCTNLHLRYPSLVYGFYHILLANRSAQIGLHGLVRDKRDVSINEDGLAEPQVLRYILAIEALANRTSQWEAPSSYEAIAVDFVESAPTIVGQSYDAGLKTDSPLQRNQFLQKLLQLYDFRYPFMAESLPSLKRFEWAADSPLFEKIRQDSGAELASALGYEPRLSA